MYREYFRVYSSLLLLGGGGWTFFSAVAKALIGGQSCFLVCFCNDIILAISVCIYNYFT